MRIGVISPYSLTVFGGVQDQVLGLARSLRTLGHAVRVLGPCDGAPPEPGVTPLGASIPTATNGSVAPLAPDIPCALRTIRALWDEEFDVLHLHEPIAPGPTHTALIMRYAPMLGTFHRSGDSKAYRLRGVKNLARRLDGAAAVSPDAKALADGALDLDCTVLWNGIEIDRYAKADPHPTEAPTVMFIGRNEPRKGLDVLLEAFTGLDLDARLWVCGPGTDAPHLRRSHTDRRISWIGPVSHEEKQARLRGADVFCVPSLSGESFGIVLLEGMAAGTAVVASDIAGYRNVARTGDEAVLVPPGDATALRIQLADLLASPRRRVEQAEAGADAAVAFSMDRLAERYVELYRRLL